VGTVEEVGKEGKKSLSSYDELWEIMNSNQSGKSKLSKQQEESAARNLTQGGKS
jgi:hypothetical protein